MKVIGDHILLIIIKTNFNLFNKENLSNETF
jgi:hypothetical protein